jgi:dTDP-4-dehydrorhamnose reductase
VFDLAGVQVQMEPIDTRQTRRRAIRPPYSALASARLAELGLNLMRPWQDALRDYLKIKGVI